MTPHTLCAGVNLGSYATRHWHTLYTPLIQYNLAGVGLYLAKRGRTWVKSCVLTPRESTVALLHQYKSPDDIWFEKPSTGGTIIIRGDEKDVVHSLEWAYKDAAAANPDAEEDVAPLTAPMKKKKLFSEERTATKQMSLNANGTGATVVIGGNKTHK